VRTTSERTRGEEPAAARSGEGLPRFEREAGSSAVLRAVRASEDRRAVLAGLARTLIQRRRLSSEDAYGALGLSLGRLAALVEAEGAFFLLVDATVQEASCLCAALGRDPLPSRWRRDVQRLERATLRARDLGALARLHAPGVLAPVPPGARPGPLEEVMRSDVEAVLAVPAALSQRLTGVLAVCNRPGATDPADPFPADALEVAEEAGRLMARVVQRSLGLGAPVSEEEQARCLAILASCAFTPLGDGFEPDRDLVAGFDPDLLRRTAVLPLRALGGRAIEAAVPNPLDVHSLSDFELASGRRVAEKVAAPRGAIRRVLAALAPGDDPEPPPEAARVAGDEVAEMARGLAAFRDEGEVISGLAREVVDDDSAPIVRFVHRLIEDACLRGASDVHVEPGPEGVRIRYRIDGVCGPRVTLAASTARALVARLKIMGGLDIAERRLPQDGRIDFGRYRPDLQIDLRVSVLPMQHGEWVCLRLLEKKRAALPLDDLGFSPANEAAYRRAIQAPNGMVLHCGPTGAGKSMTLYAALREIRTPELEVLTAEDPVEYTLDGIGQLEVRPKIGLDFASALRSFLRHDPDVILVGEIRDGETARIAVQAALTGHLLLSTLHTNDAASSVDRLAKLGIERYLVASTLLCVCAQRLVRRLCACKESVDPSPAEAATLRRARGGGPLERIHHARGCEHCAGLGYRGRTGVHELMPLTTRLRGLLGDGATTEALRSTARQQGMRTLFEDGVDKVKAGVTSLDEVLRVSLPDEVI